MPSVFISCCRSDCRTSQ